MRATTDPTDPTSSALSLASPSDNAMNALYRAALGPLNSAYYLPVFERFDATGRTTTSWNWAACLCTLGWMVFRQLWAPALVYVAAAEGLGLLVFALGRVLLQWPQGIEWGVLGTVAMLAFVVPGMYGNAMLHADIRKRIARALTASRTVPEACAVLAGQASSRRRLQMVGLGHGALVAAAAVAYLLIPQTSSGTGFAMQPEVTVAQAASAGTAAPAPMATGAVGTLTEALPAVAPASAASAPPAAPEPTPTASAAAPAVSTAAPLPVAPLPQAPEAPGTAAGRTVAAAAQASPAPPPAAPAPAPVSDPAAVPRPATADTFAVGQSPSAPTAPAPAPTPAPKAANASAQAPAAAASRPAARASQAKAPAAPTPAVPPPVGSVPGYYINVGLFAEEPNARRAQARLLNEGLPAFRQELSTPAGRRIRVRVGPYPTRAKAGEAAAAIRSMDLEAVVFKQP